MKEVQCRAFRPHGQDDVAAEAFASSDLVGDLEGDLNGDQVSTATRPPEPRPRVGGPQEVLVLDVHEPAGFADGGDIGVLNGEVHDLALRCRQHKTQPMLTSLFGSAASAIRTYCPHCHVLAQATQGHLCKISQSEPMLH